MSTAAVARFSRAKNPVGERGRTGGASLQEERRGVPGHGRRSVPHGSPPQGGAGRVLAMTDSTTTDGSGSGARPRLRSGRGRIGRRGRSSRSFRVTRHSSTPSKHGKMAYLAESREARRRLDTDAILEGAKSVICVAERVRRHAREVGRGPEDERNEADGVAPYIARYARGSDYHNHLRRRLRRLAAFVRTLGRGSARPADLRRRPGARARMGGARGARVRRQERPLHRAGSRARSCSSARWSRRSRSRPASR